MNNLADIGNHSKLPGMSPDDLDAMVPSRSTLPRTGDRWGGTDLRANAYEPYECHLPPLRDFLLIAYKEPAFIARKLDDGWQKGIAQKGYLTLTSAMASSAWYWNTAMHNYLLHIKTDTMLRAGLEVFDRDISNIVLDEELFVEDPILTNAIAILEGEARQPGGGEKLLVESLTNQICIILLRQHSNVALRPANVIGGLSPHQARVVLDYIDGNLASNLTIADLATVIQISPFHFSRQFKHRFGVPPHTFVTTRRLERAKALLRQGDIPLKRVAAMTGFCDQAHLTRQFKRHFNVTPKVAQKRRDHDETACGAAEH